jgi:hypothetical protein
MRPTITLNAKISFPAPNETTAVASLKVTASSKIAREIFVCRYIPESAIQEAHYEFYNVAYADQMFSVPTEPETKNKVCFVRRAETEYYSSSPATAKRWCEAIYKEVQRLLQSYNTNYPLGTSDKVVLTEEDITIVPGAPEDGSDTEWESFGKVVLVKEDSEGRIKIPDGQYPIAIEHNSVLYRISDVTHDKEESEFIISTEAVRSVADVGGSSLSWKVWCIVGADEGFSNTEQGVAMGLGCDNSNVMGTVVEAVESAEGFITIPDNNYPVGLEHNGKIYNITEVVHNDNDSTFTINTNEVRVLADFNGVKSYWRVWCMAQDKDDESSSSHGSSTNGMIW